MNFRAIQDFPKRFPQGALFPLQGARDPRGMLRETLLVAPARPQAADFWCLGVSRGGKNRFGDRASMGLYGNCFSINEHWNCAPCVRI